MTATNGILSNMLNKEPQWQQLRYIIGSGQYWRQKNLCLSYLNKKLDEQNSTPFYKGDNLEKALSSENQEEEAITTPAKRKDNIYYVFTKFWALLSFLRTYSQLIVTITSTEKCC